MYVFIISLIYNCKYRANSKTLDFAVLFPNVKNVLLFLQPIRFILQQYLLLCNQSY